MGKRVEFSDKVKLQILRRAGFPEQTRCEECGLILKKGEWEVDHTIEEWILEDIAHGLRAPLTADDGKCLGKNCCHLKKTADGAKRRAKTNRLIKKNAGITKSKSRPILGSKASGWKKPFNGPAIKR